MKNCSFSITKVIFYFTIISIPLNIQDLTLFPFVAPMTIPLFLSCMLVYAMLIEMFLSKCPLAVDRVGKASIMVAFAGILSCAGVLISGFPISEYLKSLCYVVYFPLLFLLSSQLRFSRNEIKVILYSWLIVASVVAVLGLYEAISNNTSLPDVYFNLGTTKARTSTIYYEYVRPRSIFTEPSYFAHYEIFSIFICFGLLSLVRSRWIIIVLLTLNLTAVIFTLSAGGYIVFTFAIILCPFIKKGFLTKKILKRSFITALLFLGLCLILHRFTPKFFEAVILRVLSVAEGLIEFPFEPVYSASMKGCGLRMASSYAGFSLWTQSVFSIIFGWGAGCFSLAAEKVYGIAYEGSNICWLNILAEQGLIGLLVYIYLIFSFLLPVRNISKKPMVNQSRSHYVITAINLAILGVVLSGFTSGLQGFERSLMFWLLLSQTNIIRKSLLNQMPNKQKL